MKIEATSPGKLMLFGEHAAVYGKYCIGIAVEKRMHVTIEPIQEEKVIINAPDLNLTSIEYNGKIIEPKFVTASIKHFEEKTGVKAKNIRINTKSDMKMGFGTSSTSTVSTIGALNAYYNTNLNKEEIFKLGYEVVLDIQNGKGSGYDIAAAVYGGIFKYKKGEVPIPITSKEFPFIIGHTGIKVKTVPIVEQVKKLRDANQKLIDTIFEQMEWIVNDAEKAMRNYDLQKIGELMNINQGLLYSIGVSSEILEEMIWASKKEGALGAKLCGAGIGDYMIALAPEKEEGVAEALDNTKGSYTEAKMAPEGLKIKKEE